MAVKEKLKKFATNSIKNPLAFGILGAGAGSLVGALAGAGLGYTSAAFNGMYDAYGDADNFLDNQFGESPNVLKPLGDSLWSGTIGLIYPFFDENIPTKDYVHQGMDYGVLAGAGMGAIGGIAAQQEIKKHSKNSQPIKESMYLNNDALHLLNENLQHILNSKNK